VIDPTSSTWVAVRDWAEHRLAVTREQLENPAKDEVETALLRGRVGFLKELLGLAVPKKLAQVVRHEAYFDGDE